MATNHLDVEEGHWINNLVLYSFPRIDMIPNRDGVLKKRPVGVPKNWSNLTSSLTYPNHLAYACLTGYKSNILVLDFDDINLYTEYVFKYDCLNNYPYVKTRNGFHIYFKWNDKYSNLPSKIGKLDIQGNGKCIYFPPTRYMCEGKEFKYELRNFEDLELEELPDELYKELLSYSPERPEPTSPSPVCITDLLIDEIVPANSFGEQVVSLISSRTLSNFEDWKRIVLAMKYEGFNEEFAIMTSKRANGDYEPLTEKAWDKLWNAYDTNKIKCTLGTLKYYAKRDNPEQYAILMKNNRPKGFNMGFDIFDMTSSDYAKIFMELNGEKIIYIKDDQTFNIYIDDRWTKDETKGTYMGRHIIYLTLQEYYTELLHDKQQELQDDNLSSKERENLEKQERAIKTCIRYISGVNGKNAI